VAIMHHGEIKAMGAPRELKASIGGDGVTLDDVFTHYSGGALDADSGGNYRETSRSRRTARRLS
jgi:ABC-2 type transport system ATP-binding protein